MNKDLISQLIHPSNRQHQTFEIQDGASNIEHEEGEGGGLREFLPVV